MTDNPEQEIAFIQAVYIWDFRNLLTRIFSSAQEMRRTMLDYSYLRSKGRLSPEKKAMMENYVSFMAGKIISNLPVLLRTVTILADTKIKPALDKFQDIHDSIPYRCIKAIWLVHLPGILPDLYLLDELVNSRHLVEELEKSADFLYTLEKKFEPIGILRSEMEYYIFSSDGLGQGKDFKNVLEGKWL